MRRAKGHRIAALFVVLMPVLGMAIEDTDAPQAPLVVDVLQAVEIALRDHPALAAERERVVETEAITREAWSSVYPKVDALASAVRRRDPGILNNPNLDQIPDDPTLPGEGDFLALLVPTPATTYDYRLALDQLLYAFGKVKKGINAAKINEAAVSDSVRAAELFIAREAVLNCLGLARSYQRAEVLEAERRSLERQVEQARDFLEIGTGTRLQLLQAQAALADLQPREIAAEGQIRTWRVRLNESLGRPPLSPIEVPRDLLETIRLPDLPPVDELVEASAERADVTALERQGDVRGLLGKIERANHLPEFRLTGSYGISAIDASNLGDVDYAAWDAGVYMTWNLYDGGAVRARARQFESQERQQRARADNRRAEVARNLVAAIEEYRRAIEASAAAERAIEQAEEASRVAIESRTWGAATIIDVLETERTLTRTRQQRLEAVHDARAALAQIYYQVGRLPGEDLLSPAAAPGGKR